MAEQVPVVHCVFLGAPDAATRTLLHVCRTLEGAERKRKAEIDAYTSQHPFLSKWYELSITISPYTLGD